MPLISDRDREIIRERFRQLANPVRLVYFTQHESPLTVSGQECAYCLQTRDLLEEVASLSDKLAIETHDFLTDAALAQQYGIDKIPGLAIVGARDYGVRFYGIPSGYEFATLIEDISDVAQGSAALAPQTMEALATISEPIHILVFSTPT